MEVPLDPPLGLVLAVLLDETLRKELVGIGGGDVAADQGILRSQQQLVDVSDLAVLVDLIADEEDIAPDPSGIGVGLDDPPPPVVLDDRDLDPVTGNVVDDVTVGVPLGDGG